MNYAFALILAAALGLFLVRRNMAGPDAAGEALGDTWGASPDPDNPYMPTPEQDSGPEQLPTFLESVAVTLQGTVTNIPQLMGLAPAAPAPGDPQAAANERAFLDMIAYAEGTTGPDGYRVMFGYPAPGRLAADLSDHPRQYFAFTDQAGRTLKTSAAGRISSWRAPGTSWPPSCSCPTLARKAKTAPPSS